MTRQAFWLTVMLFVAGLTGWSRQWTPDSLAGYECTTVSLPDSRVCTVTRKLSPHSDGRAVLYVHGYNDYFFQAEEGDRFVDSCYSWYAVDLHGYGRSIQPGERPYQTRHISDYYADIDSTLSIMAADSITSVALMGHSTGGLITASYMAFGNPPLTVRTLLLNSPFLEFNYNAFMRKIVLPVVSCLGSHFPNITIAQSYDDTAYGESTSADFKGRWRFNYQWKTVHPRPVTTGWISMIQDGQYQLRRHNERILVPILLMHSARSVSGGQWTPEHMTADAVLNVQHISEQGRKLGPTVTELTVDGGMHDLFLSSPQVCDSLYQSVFDWLRYRM